MSAGDWKELYAAARDGDLALVKYHIENGVDPNHQHPEILATPLVTAILASKTQIAIYLLSHGANPRLTSDFDNLTPLEAAGKMKNQLVLDFLELKGIKRQKGLGAFIRKIFSRPS